MEKLPDSLESEKRGNSTLLIDGSPRPWGRRIEGEENERPSSQAQTKGKPHTNVEKKGEEGTLYAGLGIERMEKKFEPHRQIVRVKKATDFIPSWAKGGVIIYAVRGSKHAPGVGITLHTKQA